MLIKPFLFANFLAFHLVIAGRTWIWAGGYNTSQQHDAVTTPYRNFSQSIFPGYPYTERNRCMLYSTKRHQIILYDTGAVRVFVYDISSGLWACIWDPRFESDKVEMPYTSREQLSCTLDPSETSMWAFGGWGYNGGNYDCYNLLSSFDLETRRWTRWYGGNQNWIAANYASGQIGNRCLAYIVFLTPEILMLMNGWKKIAYGVEFLYDVWQFNVTSRQMSVISTLPSNKTTFNTYGYLGQPFVPSNVNLPVGGTEYTVYHNSRNRSVYQLFSETASFITRFDTNGSNAWQYTPLRGTLSTSRDGYLDGSTYGVFSPANLPPTRQYGALFSNSDLDYFGIYSGYGRVSRADFWIFNITSAQWALIWESRNGGRPIYTEKPNQISSTASPGIRWWHKGTLDRNGVFWMFGGYCFLDSSGNRFPMEDMWVFTETDCNGGSYFNFTDYICKPCPADTFTATMNSNASCTVCPSNSTTNGTIGASRCICKKGYVGDPHNVTLGCNFDVKPSTTTSSLRFTTSIPHSAITTLILPTTSADNLTVTTSVPAKVSSVVLTVTSSAIVRTLSDEGSGIRTTTEVAETQDVTSAARTSTTIPPDDNTTGKSGSDTNSTTYAIVGAVAGSLVVISSVAFFIVRKVRSRRMQNYNNGKGIESPGNPLIQNMLLPYPYGALQQPVQAISSYGGQYIPTDLQSEAPSSLFMPTLNTAMLHTMRIPLSTSAQTQTRTIMDVGTLQFTNAEGTRRISTIARPTQTQTGAFAGQTITIIPATTMSFKTANLNNDKM